MDQAPAMQPQRVIIPYRPRFPQTVIHPNLESHRFNVVVAHRRMGKTYLAINHMIKMAVNLRLPHGRYAYMAPLLKQAKMIAWDYLKRFTIPFPGRKVNESELWVEIPNCNGTTSRIYIMGADNPDAIRGIYLDGAILDEYGQFKPDVWGSVIRPLLADRNGWCVFMGTPKGQNQFYDIYLYAQKAMAENNPAWYCALFRADETGVLSPQELEDMRRTMSDAQFRQEFLCDFTASADNVLLTIDIVTAAAAKIFTPRDLQGSPKILGVDPARFGDDRSVFVPRWGLQMLNPEIYRKVDNMTLVGHLTRKVESFRPDMTFCDAGHGAGIIDRMRQLGYVDITEVAFGGTPIAPNQYVDKRSEMWGLMYEWFLLGGAIPNLPELKTDLVVPTFSYDANNRMKLESKDDIKKRLGKSPDLGDGLAVTFAFPVQPKDRMEAIAQYRQQGGVVFARQDFDPFKD
ncbi:hypothetical protein [Anaeroselena agilis]|uniref:Terminase n=1 Tax=Anaeroselena agilis TaxID=3063788 RepID=A0ABU3NZI8_9FIRM|nr:hypothetical protein [Selenomonadales bacterium 4137-cl]